MDRSNNIKHKKGYVITKSLNQIHLESGSIAVVNTSNGLQVCTLLHTSPDGNWVVGTEKASAIEIGTNEKFYSLSITSSDHTYPLKLNQWKKSIANLEVNNSQKVVYFEILAKQFKSGKYVNTCSDCYGHFMGGKTQPICEKCNEKTTSAKIIINKNTVKRKRPRMLAPSVIIPLIRKAYEKGKFDADDAAFESWLQKQF
jgi:hypothetical protein